MSRPAQGSVARLEEIVGGAHVLADAAELSARQVDGLRPAAIVQPSEAAHVAEVIRFAAAGLLSSRLEAFLASRL